MCESFPGPECVIQVGK